MAGEQHQPTKDNGKKLDGTPDGRVSEAKGGAKPVGDDGKAEFNGGDPVELGKQGGSKSS